VRPLIVLLAWWSIALLDVPAHGEVYRYRLDPAATEISFLLDATMHKVRGTAALERGEIRFDDETGSAEGEVVIDATSAQTGNAKRDRDMHVKVLESESFPEIVLDVEGFAGDFDPKAPSEVAVSGRLRIHGAEHPLKLVMKLTPRGDRLEAATSFVVPYVEWGMKNPSKAFLRVGKEVEVTIEAAGRLATVE
jgi:polyisoprenoid-binding protein YceI